MYLHLHDGPAPLNTAENPLAPGAKPYSYEVATLLWAKQAPRKLFCQTTFTSEIPKATLTRLIKFWRFINKLSQA